MTTTELNNLKNEFGDELTIKKAIHLFDEFEDNKIDIAYKHIIVGSELVNYDFVRENILKLINEGR